MGYRINYWLQTDNVHRDQGDFFMPLPISGPEKFPASVKFNQMLVAFLGCWGLTMSLNTVLSKW